MGNVFSGGIYNETIACLELYWRFYYSAKMCIRDSCIISAGCILDGRSKIIIGQDVVLGSNVHVWTMEHSIDDPYFRVLANNALPVVIEAHAWVCSDATILPGCKIGEGVVVASRACVIKDCDDFFVYGGIPARKIRMRNRNLRYHTDSKPSWMFW